MKSCFVYTMMALAAGSFATPSLGVQPFTPPPQPRGETQAPVDLGDGKIAWLENFNHPDGTRQFTDLSGSQASVGWFNRPQDNEDFPNDSGYMATDNGRFTVSGYTFDNLGAPSAFVHSSLFDQLGFGAGSGTRQFSISMDVSFGDGDWFFLGQDGEDAFGAGPGQQVGYFNFFVSTHNTDTGKPQGLLPRMAFAPGGTLGDAFRFIGDDGSGTPSVAASDVAAALGKTLNSDDSFRIMMTFDADDGSIQGYVDDILFLESKMDNLTFGGFEDISRIEIQTAFFEETAWQDPFSLDPFVGEMSYDNLVLTNFVATPDQITAVIPEPVTATVLGMGSLALLGRRRTRA